MIDITNILAYGILFSIALFSVIATKYWSVVSTQMGAEKAKYLLMWVQIAVSAAEQTIKGSGMGAEKKKWVQDFLRSKGYDADMNEVQAMIEAEVYRMKG